jgi:hypothetical protein
VRLVCEWYRVGLYGGYDRDMKDNGREIVTKRDFELYTFCAVRRSPHQVPQEFRIDYFRDADSTACLSLANYIGISHSTKRFSKIERLSDQAIDFVVSWQASQNCACLSFTNTCSTCCRSRLESRTLNFSLRQMSLCSSNKAMFATSAFSLFSEGRARW